MDLKLAETGFIKAGDIQIPDRFFNRLICSFEQLNDLFGDGLLPGSTFTVCGRAGTGKTTLLLQLLEDLQNRGYRVGLTSGEQHVAKVALACRRLDVDIPVANMVYIEDIIETMDELDVIVIDSFQSLKSKDESLTGNAFQKYVAEKLISKADKTGCVVFVIMHMTVTGQIKGGTFLPHTLDCNIVIRSGEEYGNKDYRIIETPEKNRYGKLCEIVALFTGGGYQFDIEQPVEKPEKISKRSQKKQDEFDKILGLTDLPHITPEFVMGSLKVDYAHAYGRLADLERNGKLVKHGRGKEAHFTIAV